MPITVVQSYHSHINRVYYNTLTALTNPVEVVQVASDVVPEPGSATIEDDAILLAVVIVRLVLAPVRLLYDLTCGRTQSKRSLFIRVRVYIFAGDRITYNEPHHCETIVHARCLRCVYVYTYYTDRYTCVPGWGINDSEKNIIILRAT